MIIDHDRDGIIQVYVDKEGQMRGIGRFINQHNLNSVDNALDEITGITNIEFEYVDNELDSELSFHKVNQLESWGLATNVKGIHATSKDGQRQHIYWEPTHHYLFAEFVIYHELGHVMGLNHPDDVFSTNGDDDIMGYVWNGGSSSYSDLNIRQLQDLYL